jgi:hypothetical protein
MKYLFKREKKIKTWRERRKMGCRCVRLEGKEKIYIRRDWEIKMRIYCDTDRQKGRESDKWRLNTEKR